MKSDWELIRRDLRRSWGRVAPVLPKPPKPGKGRPREYEPIVIFEAFLKLLYEDRPLRAPLGASYPSPAPLRRELALWVTTGRFRAIWKEYLDASSGPAQKLWAEALLSAEPRRGGMDNRHLGLRRNSYWFIVAVEELRSRESRR